VLRAAPVSASQPGRFYAARSEIFQIGDREPTGYPSGLPVGVILLWVCVFPRRSLNTILAALLVGRGGRRRHKCQPLLPYEYKA
jgi:hypothetical protein